MMNTATTVIATSHWRRDLEHRVHVVDRDGEYPRWHTEQSAPGRAHRERVARAFKTCRRVTGTTVDTTYSTTYDVRSAPSHMAPCSRRHRSPSTPFDPRGTQRCCNTPGSSYFRLLHASNHSRQLEFPACCRLGWWMCVPVHWSRSGRGCCDQPCNCRIRPILDIRHTLCRIEQS